MQLRELIVVKKSGRRAPFDRDKLMRSLEIALRKRPVEPERVERMISGIVRQLESLGEVEVESQRIGELVIEGLRSLDAVAYVRFASVYRDFREVRDFSCGDRRIGERRRRRGFCRRTPTTQRRHDDPRSLSAERDRRRLHGGGACARPAQFGPHRAQSRGRRADRARTAS